MFRGLIGKAYNTKCKLVIESNLLDVINFDKILVFEDDNILIETKERLIKILGNDLRITKSYDDELLIKGNILKIEFR